MASPFTFTVSGCIGDPNCTATESPVPAGYVSTGTCTAPLSAGGCTINNNTPTPSPTPSPTPIFNPTYTITIDQDDAPNEVAQPVP